MFMRWRLASVRSGRDTGVSYYLNRSKRPPKMARSASCDRIVRRFAVYATSGIVF